MALVFLESGRPVYSGEGVRPTAAPDVWQMASAGQRVLALYKTSTVIAAARPAVADAAGGLEVRLLPPGAPAEEEAIAVGAPLAGWEVSFSAPPRPGGGIRRPPQFLSRRGIDGDCGRRRGGRDCRRRCAPPDASRRSAQRSGLGRLARAQDTARVDAVAGRCASRRRAAGRGEDPGLSPADGRRERAADAPDRELPDVLAPRTQAPAVHVHADAPGRGRPSGTDRDAGIAPRQRRPSSRDRSGPAARHRRCRRARHRAAEPARQRIQIHTRRPAHCAARRPRPRLASCSPSKTTASGLPPREQKRIFRRFYRVDQRLAGDRGVRASA